MDWSDPKHPVWNLARLVVAMVSLWLILWITASNFDFTEIRTLVLMFLVLAGGEGVTSLLGRLFGK